MPTDALVALDWTDFDADDQMSLCANLVTSHGRATPLMWMTVKKSEFAEQRNAHEDKLLARLAEVMPENVEVTILADRGFGDQARYEEIEGLGFKFIIRFRECVDNASLLLLIDPYDVAASREFAPIHPSPSDLHPLFIGSRPGFRSAALPPAARRLQLP